MESNLNYLNIEIFSPEKVHPNFTDHFKDNLYYNQCPHLCNPVGFVFFLNLKTSLIPVGISIQNSQYLISFIKNA